MIDVGLGRHLVWRLVITFKSVFGDNLVPKASDSLTMRSSF